MGWLLLSVVNTVRVISLSARKEEVPSSEADSEELATVAEELPLAAEDDDEAEELEAALEQPVTIMATLSIPASALIFERIIMNLLKKLLYWHRPKRTGPYVCNITP